MKKSLAIVCSYALFLNLLISSASAAISASTAWEVRPTVGSDLNSGCFVTGATGTDFSQQNAAQYSGTDLVIDGALDTKVTSATHNFVASDVGNCLRVSAGTGFTAGVYQIGSVGSNAATLDRAIGTVGSTGGTFRVGGGLDSIQKALADNVASNKIFVKNTGNITVTSSINLNSSLTPLAGTPYNILQGYTTTRGDSGRFHVDASTSTNFIPIDGGSANGWIVRNFEIDGHGLSLVYGVRLNQFSQAWNGKISNWGAFAIIANSYVTVLNVEMTGGTSGCVAGYQNTSDNYSRVAYSNIHDNLCTGANIGVNTTIEWSLLVNNTGASNDCITNNNGYGVNIFNNVLWGCGRDGYYSGNQFMVISNNIRNNIIGMNGRYGISANTAGTAAAPNFDGNFYYMNTTADRHNIDDTGAVNAINGAGPYTNVLDVILSANPFTNSGALDFTLNNTAGGGAAVKGAGTPGVIEGATGTGHIDGGAFQSASGGGGGAVPTGAGFVQ